MQANYIDRTIAQTMIRRKTQTIQCKKKTQKHSSLQNTTHTLKIRQHGYIRKKNMQHGYIRKKKHELHRVC